MLVSLSSCLVHKDILFFLLKVLIFFIVVALIDLELIWGMVWGKHLVSYFSIWIVNYASILYSTAPPFFSDLQHPLRRASEFLMSMGLFLGSSFCSVFLSSPMLPCSNYCGFICNLKSGRASPPASFFSNGFANLGPFLSNRHFRIRLSSIYTNFPVTLEFHWSYRLNEENLYFYDIESSYQ